jgi:phage shock protein E
VLNKKNVTTQKFNTGDYTMFNSIKGNDACKLLADGAQLVDVRSIAEFSQGALPNAINLPLQSIMAADNFLDRSKAVVLYCVSGARAATAKSYLVQLGFKDVYDLGSFQNYSCQ